VLKDGTQTKINDAEWSKTLSNRKVFDEEGTEILRVTSNEQRGLVRIYAMRSAKAESGKAEVKSEHNNIVLADADLARCAREAGEACGLSDQILSDVLGDLA
jgi:hypothetical protein